MNAFCGVLIKTVIALLLSITWLLFYKFNNYAFQFFAHSDRAHWIFLPAGLRVLAVLIFEEVGVLGLIAGAFWTLPYKQTSDLAYNMVLAGTSALAPLFAILLFGYLYSIKPNLSGLRGRHIIVMSVIAALANTALVNLTLVSFGRFHHDITQLLTIFVGDVLGVLILLGITAQIWNFMSDRLVKKGR